MTFDCDVVVVGGGQAGLAIAHCAQRRGRQVTVLDAGERIGDAWRERYDSLVLFTPAQYSGLPDTPFPAARDTYPTKDEVAEYLAGYAAEHGLEVRSSCRVHSLTRAPHNHGFVLTTDLGAITARQVVVATGPFQRPYVPEYSAELGPSVHQLHSSEYRNPASVRGRTVTIVGLGNSGAQIAEELSEHFATSVSYDRMPKRFPQRAFGKDIFWWLLRAGSIDRHHETTEASSGVGASRLIGTRVPKLLRQGKLARRDRVIDADADRLHFADGTSGSTDTVIWATGYQNDFSWIDVPGAMDAAGLPVHSLGVGAVEGLYYIGLRGLSSNGSAFLGFVGRDAERLADHIARS